MSAAGPHPTAGAFDPSSAPSLLDIAHLPIDALPPIIRIPPITKPFDVTVRPPGSKSLTNRALLLAALASGTSTLRGALVEADDAQVMIRALRQLGATIDITPELDAQGQSSGNATLRVTGVGGRWKIAPGQSVTLNLNNAGTATRFLAAAALLAPQGSAGIIIDGNARMRQRPIGELVDALRSIGAKCDYLASDGYPPLRVMPIGSSYKREVTFGRTSSSQFISAMMMVGPWLDEGLTLLGLAECTSASYVSMTELIMSGLGAQATFSEGWNRLFIGTREIRAFELEIEPDASGASYLLAAPLAASTGKCTIRGLKSLNSWQGDARFIVVLSMMGASIEVALGDQGDSVRASHSINALDFSLHQMPDTAMTAAAIACFASGTSNLTGLRTLRVKETDRIAALVTELSKLGVTVEPFTYTENASLDEGLRITPPTGGIDCSPTAPPILFDTYDDHRMAMSLALIGLRRPNVFIRDPKCVAKTYPTFWRDLAKLYA